MDNENKTVNNLAEKIHLSISEYVEARKKFGSLGEMILDAKNYAEEHPEKLDKRFIKSIDEAIRVGGNTLKYEALVALCEIKAIAAVKRPNLMEEKWAERAIDRVIEIDAQNPTGLSISDKVQCAADLITLRHFARLSDSEGVSPDLFRKVASFATNRHHVHDDTQGFIDLEALNTFGCFCETAFELITDPHARALKDIFEHGDVEEVAKGVRKTIAGLRRDLVEALSAN